jgi:Domain of unknown function (DUF3846)
MASLITASGAKSTIDIKGLDWQDITKAIGAEYFEMVRLPFTTDVMLVDEEGILRNKPINSLASIIAKQPIVGDVIIATQDEIN